jgi:indolepyruvate ferredoxin oxidoreductase, beta subunit
VTIERGGIGTSNCARVNGSTRAAASAPNNTALITLPFTRAQFEVTIERGGIGTRTSLAGFAAGFDGPRAVAAPATTSSPAPRDARGRALVERIERKFPAAARTLLVEGVRRLVDYQDFAYAELYLDRIERTLTAQRDDAVHAELARHLALWMSYEDTIRVADLKTRDARLARVRTEVHAKDAQPVNIDEYLHPRVEEICDTLPAALGAWILRTGSARGMLERFTARGRTVRTNSIRGYVLLSMIAGMRRWRRGTLRFKVEDARIEAWLGDVANAASPALALEIVRCQRLVKGYGDTHARGWRNFERIRAVWQQAGREMAPATLRVLTDAALADEEGKRLDEALARYAPA